MEEFKYEEQGLLHEMFMRQAKLTPNKTAVISPGEDIQLTYRELDEATDILAVYLRNKGVEADCVVGIYMEKCVAFTISYIAALKAGGAYMPMDISYPKQLVTDVIEDSQPTVVCVDEKLVQFIPETQEKVVVKNGWLDKLKLANEESPKNLGQVKVHLDNLAYTVYSSGTTGKPKGIQCPHRGSVFSYHYRHVTYPYTDDDEREACNVFFVWEMLRPLLRGATMFIIPDNIIYDPPRLCQFLEEHRISRILFTPSLFEAVLDTKGVDVSTSLKSMKTLVFCGEVVTTVLLDRCMKALPWVRFLNLYSISEAHDVTFSDLSQWYKDNQDEVKNKKFCTVGHLLPQVQVVVMDDDLRPQPVGVAGEIYIGGPTLARGYLNRPKLNAERFITKPEGLPASIPDRLYKAGDWGYLLSNGSFEICGRCDSMVKIRGYSIETQAVEAALLDLPMVNTGVVLTAGEEGEDKYLVAYIVPEGKASKKEVRAALKKLLPFYMVPSYFVFLSSIPILPASGKLDKKKLPPVEKTVETELNQEGLPTTDTEGALVPLWKDILSLKHVDIQESFFDLGGHSLLAARLLGKVKEIFSVDIAVRDLFIHSTISAMAKLIDAHQSGSPANLNGADSAPDLDLIKEVNAHDLPVTSMDIQLRAFWRVNQFGQRWKSARVLLTGATGFLGAFLLRDLLFKTHTRIYCLVRELPDKSGIDRIRSALVQFGIFPPGGKEAEGETALLLQQFSKRVYAVVGDVGLVNMGLSEDDYVCLATEVDFIIHAAAYVNLVYPYQALHGPNVLGTQNVLRFACTSKIKPLHHISTDAVFPNGLQDCSESADMTQYASQLTDGYSQTKWVAEQLVQKAINRGLPAAIYRLGNLSGESKKAFWNPQDFNLLMIHGCLATGQAPLVDWDVEMTPVDFVSGLIVTLTQRVNLSLGKVFHVTNCHPLKSKWLFEWMNAHNFPVKQVPFDKWCEGIRKLDPGKVNNINMIQRLLDDMITDAGYFSRLSTYTQDNLDSVLGVLDLKYPKLDHSLLSMYFYNLSKRGVIPRVRNNTALHQPLNDKVAIVTGASSGIGAAIASHLASAGAKVAMAARREEKLQGLQESIEQNDGIAISIKCDVTDREQVREMVEHTESTLGPVDILVNNAGVMYYTMMKNLLEDQWRHQVEVNCQGPLNCIAAVLDGMVKRGQGHIVNITSDAARRGFAGLAVYSGSKFFLEGLSQAMRVELAQTGIKVTTIQPGDVTTELLNRNTDTEAREAYDGSASNKILEPDDIGQAVTYAVSQPPYAAVNEILIEPRTAPI